MRLNKVFCFIAFLLLPLILSIPALTEGIETQEVKPFGPPNTFILDVTNNLINLHAEQASFKEVLNELKKKTGIKVNIFDGVEDKKVTLDITSLPVYAIHDLLEKMALENYAVVYDEQSRSNSNEMQTGGIK